VPGAGAGTLLTVGHGALAQDALRGVLAAAGVSLVVDVRIAPGSRRHPQFRRETLEEWLPQAGIAYRWDRRLGGFRQPRPDSPHVGLEHPSFRGYADHMEGAEFRGALEDLLADAARHPLTAVMCSETLWWRCHRRLIADAAVLLAGAPVLHVDGRGGTVPHLPTPEARVAGDRLVYDAGAQLTL
jgi:uncharacterized protein (DUF488 family)